MTFGAYLTSSPYALTVISSRTCEPRGPSGSDGKSRFRELRFLTHKKRGFEMTLRNVSHKEKNMDKRVTAIVVTVFAIVLCACPGLFGLCIGGMFALISFFPGANIDIAGSHDPRSALTFGVAGLCVGLFLVLIAAAAIFLVWRRNSSQASPASN
jgi:hypothetical protein